MRNSKTVYSEIIGALTIDESEDEKASIARALLEDAFGISMDHVRAAKPINWSDEESERLARLLGRVNDGEPVQYVTGYAFFYRRRFFVDGSVLIPRPETEELVSCALGYLKSLRQSSPRVLDIGTGSGCIAVTIALEHPAEVTAIDISDDALAVAQRNAVNLGANVHFIKHDILSSGSGMEGLDVIVSNPPYIAMSEKSGMKANVTAHEPHLALFVSNANPFVFYERIAVDASRALNPGGMVIFEINERFAQQVINIVSEAGLVNPEIVRDISGKDRIVKAFRAIL